MNNDRPRQITKTGRWDYSRRNDSRVYPLGYCWDHFVNTGRAGHHASEEEAIKCYTNWALDHALRFVEIAGNTHGSCNVPFCGTPTKYIAQIDGWPAGINGGWVCLDHQSKHFVALFWKAGHSVHS